MELSKKFEIKDSINLGDLQLVNPVVGVLFFYFTSYAAQYNLPVTITSITDEAPNRLSDTHRDGRAIDVSAHSWPELHIQRVCYRINSIFRNWGTAPQGKQKVAIYFHDAGTGGHFHIQVNRTASIDDVTLPKISE